MSVRTVPLSAQNYPAQTSNLPDLRLAKNAPEQAQQTRLKEVIAAIGFGRELRILAEEKIVPYEFLVLFDSDQISTKQYVLNLQKASLLLHHTVLFAAHPTDSDYQLRFSFCDVHDRNGIFKLAADIKRTGGGNKLDLFHEGIDHIEIPEWVGVFYDLKVFA